MTNVNAAPAAIPLTRPRAPARPSRPAAWATLARRRISLSAHTPREILAPLATPLLFALVIAPAAHPLAVLSGDRPGTGQDHPGGRGRRCRLQHIRHRRHRRPAHSADVY